MKKSILHRSGGEHFERPALPPAAGPPGVGRGDETTSKERAGHQCSDPSKDQATDSFRQGVIHLDRNETEAAIRQFQQAVALAPDWAEAHFNLGIAFQDQKRPEEALRSYQAALRCRPDLAEAHYNLGLVLQDQNRLDEAVGAYRRALELDPGFAEGWNNLGTALQDQGDLDQAAGCFLRALALRPDYADAHYNLGSVRHRQSRIEEAIEHYRRAIEIDPRHHKACNNIAKACQDRRETDRAVDWYRRALDIKPDYAEARFNLSTVQLLRGEYEEGWTNYEWRFLKRDWRRVYPHRFARPRWEGESFAGKTLYVHGEQGFGDVLQFVRYLPRVKALGGTVVLETRRALLPVLQGLAGVDRLVLPPGTDGPAVGFDLYVPLLSLPRVFRTDADTIPCDVPYLQTDPFKAEHWRSRFSGEELRVGLVWAGTATDASRACQLAWFGPISRLPGVRLYGLQKGPEAEEIKRRGFPDGMAMTNLGGEFEDFADTAAAIENLDLVISIDTSVAHLAGAMGKPVWLILPPTADWRWLTNREDSPWYPTMRLFRQESRGDWGRPLTRVARGLERLACGLTRAREVGGVAGLLAAAAHFHQNEGPLAALVFYERALRMEPGHPEALHGAGLVAYQTKNLNRAVELIGRAIAGSPASDRCHYHMGLAQLALRKHKKAAQAFARACELTPGNTDAAYNLSKLISPQKR